MLFADSVAKLAQLPVCPFVAPVAVIVYEVHGIEDNVIMAMPFVNVGSDHILIFAFKPFIGKLLADLMCHFRLDFTNIERLN